VFLETTTCREEPNFTPSFRLAAANTAEAARDGKKFLRKFSTSCSPGNGARTFLSAASRELRDASDNQEPHS
jgi:hypothetical protein